MRWMLLCLACSLAAGDPRAEVRAVWEAAKNGDLWTALQCEAYAARQGWKLGQALTYASVHGDIAWGFPEEVLHARDLGERIVVASGSRVRVLASDGRPLRTAIPFPFPLRQACFEPSGGVVGAVERNRGADVVRAVARRLDDGATALDASLAIGADVAVFSPCVAADGSALVATAERQGPGVGIDREERLLVLRPPPRLDDQPAVIPGMRDAWAVGPGAAWILARDSARRMAVIRGAKTDRIQSGASALGWAAVIQGRVLRLIDPRGADVAMPGAPACGDGAAVQTVGEWLVLASGRGQRAGTVHHDLLDNPVQMPAQAIIESASCWRWRDLVAAPASPPAATWTGRIARAAHLPAGLLLWSPPSAAIETVDLAGPDPVRAPFATAPAPIADADVRCGRIRIRCEGQRWLIADAGGAEVWSGTAERLDIQDRAWAIAADGGKDDARYRLLRLDLDPKQRRDVALDLPPGEWRVFADRLARKALAVRYESAWAELDPGSGKLRGRYGWDDPEHPWRQDVWVEPETNGRFYPVGARLFPTLDGEERATPSQSAQPIDAWMVGPALAVLCERGEVMIAGGPRRKAGDWMQLGRVLGGRSLALHPKGGLAVTGYGGRPLAAIVAGPNLEMGGGGGASDLPAGPWQIAGMDFLLPREGRQAKWDEGRTGFAPQRLRSPENGDLLAIAGSVVLQIGHGSGGMVATGGGRGR